MDWAGELVKLFGGLLKLGAGGVIIALVLFIAFVLFAGRMGWWNFGRELTNALTLLAQTRADLERERAERREERERYDQERREVAQKHDQDLRLWQTVTIMSNRQVDRAQIAQARLAEVVEKVAEPVAAVAAVVEQTKQRAGTESPHDSGT